MAKFVRLLIIVVLLFSVVACSGAERERQKIQKLEERALKGDLKAQRDLYAIYLDGTKYTQKDYKEAFKWLKMRADAGERLAMAALANFYDLGNGVSVDQKMAHYYSLKAAEKNVIRSQNILIINYMHGIGTEKDYFQALIWSYVLELNNETFPFPSEIVKLKNDFSNEKHLEAQHKARVIVSNFTQPPHHDLEKE